MNRPTLHKGSQACYLPPTFLKCPPWMTFLGSPGGRQRTFSRGWSRHDAVESLRAKLQGSPPGVLPGEGSWPLLMIILFSWWNPSIFVVRSCLYILHFSGLIHISAALYTDTLTKLIQIFFVTNCETECACFGICFEKKLTQISIWI